MTTERVERRLAAVLSADVVGYSRLMEADEAGTLARLQSLLTDFIEPKIAEHRGRVVKLMGDGALVEFASVIDAVQCASDIQRGMAERNAGEPDHRRMDIRIGVNVGDIIIEGDDIHGEGVNVAARLQTLAERGGICISGESYRQAEGKVDVGFADLGDQIVKNITKPIRVYRVLLEPEAAGKVVAQKEGRKRLPKRWRWAIPAAAAVVVIGVAAGVLLSLEPWVPRIAAADPAKMAYPLPDEPSVAVMPFKNLSGDPTNDHVADGVSETIITLLGTIPEIFVTARESTFIYKGKTVEEREVAEKFGVRYVVEGSVLSSGDTIRINTRLIDAIEGYQHWSSSYDRESANFLALLDDVTLDIVDKLHKSASPI